MIEFGEDVCAMVAVLDMRLKFDGLPLRALLRGLLETRRIAAFSPSIDSMIAILT
jgi:hypothetical protein